MKSSGLQYALIKRNNLDFDQENEELQYAVINFQRREFIPLS